MYFSLEIFLTIDGPKNVTASFSLVQHKLTVNLLGDGSGTVTSQPPGIDCGADCSHDFDYNQKVTLSATVDSGSNFTTWGGACSGAGTCEVSMTEARTVSAAFNIEYRYSVYLPLEIR